MSAWNVLIKDALVSDHLRLFCDLITNYIGIVNYFKQDKDISQTREFFEELTSQFPTCGRFWKIYIEQEVKLIHEIQIHEKRFNGIINFFLDQREKLSKC